MSVEHLGLQSGSFTSLFSIWSRRIFKLTGNLNTNILELNYYWCFQEDQTFPCQQKKRQHAPVKSCIILRDSPPPQAMLYNQWVLTFRYSFQNILALTFANTLFLGFKWKLQPISMGKKTKNNDRNATSEFYFRLQLLRRPLGKFFCAEYVQTCHSTVWKQMFSINWEPCMSSRVGKISGHVL